MATKLKGLVVDRVDLVDIGANLDKRTGDGAHIMLFKRGTQEPAALQTAVDRIVALAKAKGASAELIAKAEAMARSFGEILSGQKARRALDSLWDLYYAFMESAQSIFASDEADKIGLLKDSAIDFMNAFLGALPEAVDDAEIEMGVAKIGRKISSARMKQLQEMHAKLGSLLKDVSEGEDTMKLADYAKSLGISVADTAKDDEIQNAITKHFEAQAIAKGDGDVAKKIETALAAERVAQAAELAKRDEAIAKAQAEAKVERDARILKQFDDKARGDFAGLSLQLEKAADKPEAKTDAEVFKAISEKAPEEWQRVEAILKGAAEAIRTGKLFVEEGSAGGNAAAGSAEQQIMQLADALVKSGGAPTQAQAIAKVAVDPKHAALYGQYTDEQRAKTKH